MLNELQSAFWAALPTLPHPDRSPFQAVLAEGSSALRDLIGWICATYPTESRRLLRTPIWISPGLHADLTPSDLTALKVFAKRLCVMTTPPPDARRIEAPSLVAQGPLLDEPLPISTIAQPTQMQIAQAMLQVQASLRPLAPGSSRTVVALALDAKKQPLAWTRNQGAIRRDAHAENVLVATLRAQAQLDAVAQIWVTLKPCRFCATLLYPLQVPIFYLEEDPGPWGRATCLDAHSPDRRRFFPTDLAQREFLFACGH